MDVKSDNYDLDCMNQALQAAAPVLNKYLFPLVNDRIPNWLDNDRVMKAFEFRRDEQVLSGDWTAIECCKIVEHNFDALFREKIAAKEFSIKNDAQQVRTIRNKYSKRNKVEVPALELDQFVTSLHQLCTSLGNVPNNLSKILRDVKIRTIQLSECSPVEVSTTEQVNQQKGINELVNVSDSANGFRDQVGRLAQDVVTCQQCREWAEDLGCPNPGWVGKKFTPGKGIVVLLRNPATIKANYGMERDAKLQSSIEALGDKNGPDLYERHVQEHIDDMLGRGNSFDAWPRWKDTVAQIINGLAKPAELAWLNVCKHRTPDDAELTREQIDHGMQHLRAELAVLQPYGVIAVGAVARTQITRTVESGVLDADPYVLHIPQRGATSDHLAEARKEFASLIARRDGLPVSASNQAMPPNSLPPLSGLESSPYSGRIFKPYKREMRVLRPDVVDEDFRTFLRGIAPEEQFSDLESTIKWYFASKSARALNKTVAFTSGRRDGLETRELHDWSIEQRNGQLLVNHNDVEVGVAPVWFNYLAAELAREPWWSVWYLVNVVGGMSDIPAPRGRKASYRMI